MLWYLTSLQLVCVAIAASHTFMGVGKCHLCSYIMVSCLHILTGTDVPTLQQLNAHVRPLIADVWYDLGLQLFDPKDVSELDTIMASYPNNPSGACTKMFSLWLQRNPSASWNSLIKTIKGPGVGKHNVACKIEQMFQLGKYTIKIMYHSVMPARVHHRLPCTYPKIFKGEVE